MSPADYRTRDASLPIVGSKAREGSTAQQQTPREFLIPLASDLSDQKAKRYLAVIEFEASQVKGELEEAREARRKLRDLGMNGMFAAVAAVIGFFAAASSPTKMGVALAGYLLLVIAQVGLPLYFFEKKQDEETDAARRLRALEEVRLEFQLRTLEGGE